MKRFHRLRFNESIRSMVRETRIEISDLVYPIFVIEGDNIRNPVESMPGIYQYSIDNLHEVLDQVKESKIKSILLFGIPRNKDDVGSGAYDPNGITQKAIKYIKDYENSLLIIADVCLCEYTSHGHCGIIHAGHICNDETLPYLGKMALSLVRAGADIIAPSDMMDGRIQYLREQLDEEGFKEIPIMAYSAKFASGYYAPFREAAHSAPAFGDRKSYQMDYCNRKEALREMEADVEEGADFIMIKPALAYLDVIRDAANHISLPIVAYNVSGEYSMVKAAAKEGWIDEKKIVMENLIAMKRAGVKIIITYHGLDVARWIKEERRDSIEMGPIRRTL